MNNNNTEQENTENTNTQEKCWLCDGEGYLNQYNKDSNGKYILDPGVKRICPDCWGDGLKEPIDEA